jgi:hypothetical protein
MRLLLVFCLAGTAGVPRAAAPQQVDARPPEGQREVRISVELENVAEDVTRVKVQLWPSEPGSRIGSYQGEVTLASSRLQILEVEIPQGVAGTWNRSTAETVRFAGASVEGLPPGTVLSLIVRSEEAVRRSHIGVVVEELTSRIP